MSAETTARRDEFEELLFENLGAALALATRLTREMESAEDIVQESCLRAYRFFHRFERGTNFKAWLLRIVQNTFINEYRKTKRDQAAVELATIGDPWDDGLRDLSRTVVRQRPERDPREVNHNVERALEDVPEPFRLVVELCLVWGFTYEEAAERLGVPRGMITTASYSGHASATARRRCPSANTSR